MHMYCFLTLRVHLDQRQVILFWPWLLCYQLSHTNVKKAGGMCLWLTLHSRRPQRAEAGGSGIGPIPALTLLLSSPLPGVFCQFCADSCWGVEGCWLCCARIFLALLQSWLLVCLCFWVRLHLSRIVSLAFLLFSFFPSSAGMFTSKIALFSPNHEVA